MTIRIIKEGERPAVGFAAAAPNAASTAVPLPTHNARHPLDILVITLAKKAAWEDHLKELKNKDD